MNELQPDPRSFHVPAGPVESPPPEAAVPPTPPRPRRRRWPWILAILALLAAVPAYVTVSAWRTWAGVERVDLDGVTTGSVDATNYLVVGTDSRAGVDPDVENADNIFGSDGERTDTIAVLRVAGDDVSLLAIPRDLWVDIGGSSNRINAAFAFGGPEQLVRTVQDALGIGIDHYLEVDFAGFLGLVDALDGVTIDFPYPAHDPKSGLAVGTSGPTTLDGAQALAYVRSRTYTEIIDGRDVVDPRSDLGRVERQQAFLSSVFSELGSTKNPFTMLDVLDGVAGNVRVDKGLGMRTAMSLGLTVRGAEPTTAVLPTFPFTTDGGAAVLLLDDAAAAPVLAAFR